MSITRSPNFAALPTLRGTARRAGSANSRARLRPTVLAVALQGALAGGLVIGAATASQQARAQDSGVNSAAATALPKGDAVKSFDIPAGPLDAALDRFARAAGVNLSYDEALVAGRSTRGVNGSLSVTSGLLKLLEGSGLEPLAQPGGGYSLRRSTRVAAPVSAARTSSTALSEVIVTAAPLREPSTEGTGSYAARGATLFKGAESLKDIPQSVTVITRQQMDDQGLETLYDVLDNTPGVTLVKRAQGGSDITSRGFPVASVQYDGVPLPRFGPWGNTFAASTVDLDRVEVLRGAQGLLEGAGDPAGSVNLVRKRGLADKRITVEGRAGSWDTYGTQLDAGGPLDKDGRVRGRLVLDYERTGSFLDTVSDRNLNAYGALDFDLAPDTTFGMGLVHSRRKGNSAEYDGIPTYTDGRLLGLPSSAYISADWSGDKRTETRLIADLEHNFDADWKLKVAGTYLQDDSSQLVSTPNGLVPIGGGVMPGLGYDYHYKTKSYGIDASLTGKFTAAGLQHDVVLGANYGKQARDDAYVQYRNHFGYPLPTIVRDVPPLSMATPTRIATNDIDTVSKGFYGMVRTKLTSRLTSVLGARISWFIYDANYLYSNTGPSVTYIKKDATFTPYAGLVYAVTPQWSAYASYADIFKPQAEMDVHGKVLEPILGANYEAGVKGELFDGALNTSLAVFRIDQKNLAVWDGNESTCGASGAGLCYQSAGKVRTQGIELEVHGNLTRSWQISGGYTYQRNKYLKVDIQPELVGTPFNYNTPEQIFRLWSNWKLPGAWSQWQLGTGVNYRSAMRTGSTTRLDPVQGGYSVWNARIAYQINPKWQAALNINNVFDKHYLSYVRPNYYANYTGEPRRFMLTLRGSF
ncbi:TonB-dependent siderophore receptor [Pseudorhodoferax sp.]|uniref:TonB-dependent siderophore receptor n=1 Tax=Pseudorhodoferax sp. TaxID=1993553 RepID=UPI0039E27F1E